MKYHSLPVYNPAYIKPKVREYDGVTKADFLSNGILNGNMHYNCIFCITIDSVMRMDQKYLTQVYLEECRYNIKKIQMSRFINVELESYSELDDDLYNDSD